MLIALYMQQQYSNVAAAGVQALTRDPNQQCEQEVDHNLRSTGKAEGRIGHAHLLDCEQQLSRQDASTAGSSAAVPVVLHCRWLGVQTSGFKGVRSMAAGPPAAAKGAGLNRTRELHAFSWMKTARGGRKMATMISPCRAKGLEGGMGWAGVALHAIEAAERGRDGEQVLSPAQRAGPGTAPSRGTTLVQWHCNEVAGAWLGEVETLSCSGSGRCSGSRLSQQRRRQRRRQQLATARCPAERLLMPRASSQCLGAPGRACRRPTANGLACGAVRGCQAAARVRYDNSTRVTRRSSRRPPNFCAHLPAGRAAAPAAPHGPHKPPARRLPASCLGSCVISVLYQVIQALMMGITGTEAVGSPVRSPPTGSPPPISCSPALPPCSFASPDAIIAA